MQESDSPTRKTNGRWTKEEHLRFLEGLRVYGKNWKKIEQLVETRSGSQIRSHAQKFFLKVHHSNSNEFNSLSLEEQAAMDAEEATLHSKALSQSMGKRESMSFYLGRIMDHLQGQQNVDFWTSLVDLRDATENSNHPRKTNSFVKLETDHCQAVEEKGPPQGEP